MDLLGERSQVVLWKEGQEYWPNLSLNGFQKRARVDVKCECC